MSPRGGSCNHRECISWGEGCRQLTAEELEPTPEDRALAEELVRGGWRQISRKHRSVARVSPDYRAEDWIAAAGFPDELRLELIRAWRGCVHFIIRGGVGLAGGKFPVEERSLTLREFRAYCEAGGGP